jgi:hypothetical protein
MFSIRTALKVYLFVIIFGVFAGTIQAKSVYVINNTNTSQLCAYRIDGTSLVYQTDYFCESGTSAVGLAIDESEYGGFLFVTFESSPAKIEIIDAKTMQYADIVTNTGAYNLAGIVVDKGKRKVYAIDRSSHGRLFIYYWEAQTKTLTPALPSPYYVLLPGCENTYGYGIALDEENGRLYVGDNTNKIKYYNTNDWSKEGEINNVSCNVISIAIDVPNQLLYYGSMGTYGQGDPHLYQYDISGQTESSVDVGCSVAGIAIDRQSSLVYLTTYGGGGDTFYPYPPQDRLMIYNSNLVKQPWESGDIGSPAGVCVPSGDVEYKPPLFYLAKVDYNEPNSVLPGDYITYQITYGPNGYADTNVVITDYLPQEVDYINPLDPNYNSSEHTYKWIIGSLAANDPNKSVTLTVKVNQGAAPDCNISNYCEIESDTACTPATADTSVGYWQPNSQIIYVDCLSPCAPGTGMSWRFAYRDLQNALARAQAYSSQIWVAAGTYKPTWDVSDTDANFALVSGVPIYGGFPSGGGQQRNWVTNETILDSQISSSAFVFCVVTANGWRF